MKEVRKPLYIPVNTQDADDFVQGIGSIEVTIMGISMVISVVLGLLLFSISNDSILAVAIAAVIIAVTLLAVRRDIYNENLIKKIRIVRNYYKAQKQFEYRHGNIYECGEPGFQDEDDVWK